MGLAITAEMSNMIYNMYIKRIKASSVKEAVKKAPFHIIGDATASYRSAGNPTDSKILFQFCKRYLELNSGLEECIGFIVTLKKPTKKRRLKTIKIKNSSESLYDMKHLDTRYVLYGENNERLASFMATDESEAIEKAKTYIVDRCGDIHSKFTCKIEYVFTEGIDNRVFEIEDTEKCGYSGEYLIFGIQSVL